MGGRVGERAGAACAARRIPNNPPGLAFHDRARNLAGMFGLLKPRVPVRKRFSAKVSARIEANAAVTRAAVDGTQFYYQERKSTPLHSSNSCASRMTSSD